MDIKPRQPALMAKVKSAQPALGRVAGKSLNAFTMAKVLIIGDA